MKGKIILILTASFIFSGCFATSREVIDLRDDISHLQIKINELQQNQADLSVKMDALISNLDPLSAKLMETQNRMSFLGQRLDDVESNITSKMDRLSEKMSGTPLPKVLTPTEMYNAAYSDYSAGKFDLAQKGFFSYIEKYPNSEMAPQAQYYLGECYFSKADYENALSHYRLVRSNYPKSSLIAASMLREGLSLELLGKKIDSVSVLNDIVKNYPGSPEADSAKAKLGLKKTDAK